MSNWFTDDVVQAWAFIKSKISGVEQVAANELTVLEQKYLPAFHAFITTEITQLSGQGLQILDEEIATISSTFLSGGDVAGAIVASVPKVLAEVKSDIAADIAAAKNAIYTAIGLALAQASSQANTSVVTPSPAEGSN